MQILSRVAAASAAFACIAHCALAHNHITIDTSQGITQIRAGYYPAESALYVADGRLMLGDEIAQFAVEFPLSAPAEIAGWYAGDELLLTSDYYLATGRLNGGDFAYEIANVTKVGSGAGAVVAWGAFDEVGAFSPQAFSTATSRAGRSFAVGIGGHDHEQGCAFSTRGVYDVTFIAYDVNGVYADSLPLTVRFVVGEACDSIDFNGNGVFPEDQDVIDFFNVLAGGECPTGTCSDIDFNNNGVFPEDQDVIDFFNVLAGGVCP
ncbi:hypothetical protein LBMAG48_01120 [Phycisphaerae bacterium]|nr:hypothetical protein LBMAG48_01120 [Phycisphaerae bacterium]